MTHIPSHPDGNNTGPSWWIFIVIVAVIVVGFILGRVTAGKAAPNCPNTFVCEGGTDTAAEKYNPFEVPLNYCIENGFGTLACQEAAKEQEDKTITEEEMREAFKNLDEPKGTVEPEIGPTIDIPIEAPRDEIVLNDVQCGEAMVPDIDPRGPFSPLSDTGLVVLEFDRNQDGYSDYALLYQTKHGNREPYPLFYMVDVDFDDWADLVFIDLKGDGKCTSIKLYSNRKSPQYSPFEEGMDACPECDNGGEL